MFDGWERDLSAVVAWMDRMGVATTTLTLSDVSKDPSEAAGVMAWLVARAAVKAWSVSKRGDQRNN